MCHFAHRGNPTIERQVHQHVEKIRQALSQNEFLDVETVERMADVLTGLLDRYETYSESHKALIVEAVRYFVKADDAEPDTVSLLGFDSECPRCTGSAIVPREE
jgi:hypothetical protein